MDTAFLQEVEQAIVLYEKTIGNAATRTRQVIKQYGAIKTLSRLMVSPDLQKGFKVLRDSKQLDKTFEAVVIRFKHLFERDVVEAAQWRLANPDHLL